MSNIECVPLEDVYPSECNPRSDFGDIKALAESFDFNAENPGEPFNPPVVVRDGGIFRIIDGERRYRAMRQRKLARAHVLVCEDMDEANAVCAMLATDDKQPLTEVERSRGVQQMLLLGVDPERADKAARLPSGTAIKAKRAREVVDDAAEDMSLLRLIAIAEFEGDPDAVEELTNCSEREFPAIERRLKEGRERAEKMAAIEEALSELGIEVAEERPVGMRFRTTLTSAKDIPDDLAKGAVCVLGRSFPTIYEPAPEADPVEEARKARYADLSSLHDEAEESIVEWLIKNIERPMPALWAIEGEDPYTYSVSRFLGSHELELPKGPADSIKAYMDNCGKPFAPYMSEPSEDGCKAFVALIDALREEGYEPGSADIEAYEAAKAALGEEVTNE